MNWNNKKLSFKNIEKKIYELNKQYENKSRSKIISEYRRINNQEISNKYSNSTNKGNMGMFVEEIIFGVKTNSRHDADIDGEFEIKTIPLKKNENNIFKAKERLIFSMINYEKIVNENNIKESSFFKKNKNLILVFYEFNSNINKNKIILISYFALDKWNKMSIMESDYSIIYEKVISGKAHEISGKDTVILEAVTKGANSSVLVKQPFNDIKAKPRAFGLKNYGVTEIFYLLNNKNNQTISFQYDIGEILNKILNHKGMNIEELQNKFKNYSISKSNKHNLILKMLGVKSLDQINVFVTENIIIKTINLEPNGELKEHIPLSRITLDEMMDNIKFEDSSFAEYLNQKILFVIFKKNKKSTILEDAVLIQFNENDIEKARMVYYRTQETFISNNFYTIDNEKNRKKFNFVKSSENIIFHVRPKARDSKDIYDKNKINNMDVPKQVFWLNKNVLLQKLSK